MDFQIKELIANYFGYRYYVDFLNEGGEIKKTSSLTLREIFIINIQHLHAVGIYDEIKKNIKIHTIKEEEGCQNLKLCNAIIYDGHLYIKIKYTNSNTLGETWSIWLQV